MDGEKGRSGGPRADSIARLPRWEFCAVLMEESLDTVQTVPEGWEPWQIFEDTNDGGELKLLCRRLVP